MQKSKLLILLLPVFLAACITNPPAPPSVQRVEIPVSVPCKVDIPVVPPFKVGELDINDDIYRKAQILLYDRTLHLAYEIELLAALNSCIK